MKKQPKRKITKKKTLKPKKGNISDLKTRKLLYKPKTKLVVVECGSCNYRESLNTPIKGGCWDCFFTGKELAEKIVCEDCKGTGKFNIKAFNRYSEEERLLESIFGRIGKSSLKSKTHCTSCQGKGIRYKYPYAMRGSVENTFKETKKKG